MRLVKSLGIGTKLMIFVVTAVILIIAFIVGTALVQFNSFNNTVSQEQAVKGMEGLNSLIEDYKYQSLKLATLISLNLDVISAVETKDANSIFNVVSSIANEAKIDFITITDNNGIVLIRSHDANKKADSVMNQTNIQMALKGKSYSTVESGTIVKLSARTGVPIKNKEGIIIGAVSTGYMLDKVEILDKLKQIYKTDITLFLGDTRFNTTIVQNGNRLVGTKLDPKIAEILLNKKEKYIGNATILGMPFICAYMPLINSDNQVIGILFAGQPLQQVIASRNNIIAIVVVIAAVATLIFAASIYFYITKKVSKPLSTVVSAAEKIADRNLDVSIDFKSNDEIGILCNEFNKMTDNLNEVLNNISIASKQVASGSSQVSSSSIALSQGATEQASSIQQLTATLDEISTQTKQNAQSANDANKLVETAKSDALTCNDQMKQMLVSMEQINKSSNNISRIIKVIDEIAFQTNILALNAAVEAARAGQHGKGFAVVAEEVRNLAIRSAKAAKETTDMIEGSINKVEDGTKIANKTAEALNNIVDGFSKVANLVKTISLASNEQATGITQVNQAISQVSQVIQTNSATSQESAAASEELSSQAEILKNQVDRFVLKKNTLSSYKGFENIDPDILRTLEDMSEVEKGHSHSLSNKTTAKSNTSNKSRSAIELNDKGFDKY